MEIYIIKHQTLIETDVTELEGKSDKDIRQYMFNPKNSF